jgi:GT2 family glycosyltransferase
VTGPLSPRAAVRLSWIVLSWNSARYIEACIRSLIRDGAGQRDEIWVVDNGSADGTVDVLKRLSLEFPEVLNVLYLSENRGTTVSRNLALVRTRGAYVAIVDSDVTVPPGTVASLLATLHADPKCGLVAPRLVFPSGRAQLSTDVFPTLQRKLQRLIALKRMEKKSEGRPVPAVPIPVDYAISAFWLLRREVIDVAGLLDERIFYAPEDVDYCIRVWRSGFKVVYDPRVCCIHDAQEISRRSWLSWAALSHAKGLAYLFWKHRYAWSRDALYERIGRLPLKTSAA